MESEVCVSHWCKCLHDMNVVASKITSHLTVFQYFQVNNNNQENNKFRTPDPLWRESTWRWPMDSPHKGPVMLEVYLYHGVWYTYPELAGAVKSVTATTKSLSLLILSSLLVTMTRSTL